jgi:hypothetical protein
MAVLRRVSVDANRFDVLTKRAAGTSRRRILTALAGGFMGGLGLLREQPGAAQDYDKRGQTCTPNAECNAPCRRCDVDDLSGVGRCVYACETTQVCDATGTSTRCMTYLNKGCCASR